MPQAWTKKVNLKGPKGDPGTKAGFGTPTASIQNEGGEPSVIVTATGDDTAKVFDFVLQKGDKGDPGQRGATITVGNGAPTELEGMLANDLYIDADTGDLYQFGEAPAA